MDTNLISYKYSQK